MTQALIELGIFYLIYVIPARYAIVVKGADPYDIMGLGRLNAPKFY